MKALDADIIGFQELELFPANNGGVEKSRDGYFAFEKKYDGDVYEFVGGAGGPTELVTSDDGHDGWPGAGPGRGEIYGDGGDNNFIEGTANAEKIYGFAGDDGIYAGAGDDKAFGGLGDDIVFGDAGDDILVGGDGEDVSWGGDGDDTHYLENDGDADRVLFAQGDDNDVVFGFDVGQDKIELNINGIDDYDDLLAQATILADDDGEVLIDFGDGDSILLVDLAGPLTETDFTFV